MGNPFKDWYQCSTLFAIVVREVFLNNLSNRARRFALKIWNDKDPRATRLRREIPELQICLILCGGQLTPPVPVEMSCRLQVKQCSDSMVSQ